VTHETRTFLWVDPLIAASLLTRAPVPVDHALAGARAGAASWAHPLAGAVIGALIGAAHAGGLALGLAPLTAAVAAIALGLILTGALHEDGLADCADGFGGGYTPARRLEIMKDSRLGTFGGAALTLALVAKASLLSGFSGPGAIAALAIAGAVSRAFTAAGLAWVPPARAGGLSARAGAPGLLTVVAAIALALVLATTLGGAPSALRALAAAGLAALIVHRIALRLIGGQTGDVLGAAQVLGEIAALATLAGRG
jgi:adenosylcobinamide-GDP ribazoletransferase